MNLSDERAGQVVGGIWLIGLGLLFYLGKFWPGIMFVIGGSAIIEGLVKGRGWYAFQGGLWAIAIGVWALLHFNLAVLLVAIGVSMVLGAFLPPPGLRKPAPITDHSLD